MSDTAYDAQFGIGFSFTFTPVSGSAFGSEQAQVEEANTPNSMIETAKYTPISGANSGKEQIALGRFTAQEYKIKVTYSSSEHTAAIACLTNKKKGTLVCTYGDESQETYADSALTGVTPGPNMASGLRTAELTFTVPCPPVVS